MKTVGILATLVIAFVAGLALASSPTPKTVTPQPTPVQACSSEETWRKLKEIDDEAFQATYRAFGLASQMMDAMAQGDKTIYIEKKDEFKENTNEIVVIGVKRNYILKQLGY